jgi:hypothetical protein
MKTYFCVRSDTRQIFDAVGKIPSEKYLHDYSVLYGCEITVIEGTTVKEYNAQQKMHPTLGESSASDSESKPAPKRVI